MSACQREREWCDGEIAAERQRADRAEDETVRAVANVNDRALHYKERAERLEAALREIQEWSQDGECSFCYFVIEGRETHATECPWPKAEELLGSFRMTEPDPCGYPGCDRQAVAFVDGTLKHRACTPEHARSISAIESEPSR